MWLARCALYVACILVCAFMLIVVYGMATDCKEIEGYQKCRDFSIMMVLYN